MVNCDLPSLVRLALIVFIKACMSSKGHTAWAIGCLPKLFFRNLESAVSSLSLRWLRLVKTSHPPSGHVQMSIRWPFEVWGPESPPSQHANAAVFWACLPWRNLWLGCICTEQRLPLPFLISNYLSPCSPCLSFYPINISSPSPSGRQIWDFSRLLTWMPQE